MTKTKKKNELFDWIKSLIIAVLIVVIARYFLFTPIIVQGKSMKPSLYNGDRMIVSKIGTPKRFDIIVFHATKNKDYIKRVIGLPGDTIEYKNDNLYINGKVYQEEYLDKSKKQLKGLKIEGPLTEDFSLTDKIGRKTVPEGSLFVMGDNRRHSTDSREIGVIPINKVIGKPILLYWPIKDFQIVK
ncbi:signal peptidase I [Heyndrickxia sp. NPDC080065]|uniref:signal peptidase I n=1 Tax=Heyndrickxia sp. NPDC080065 TaxID=3390568 RepID=UPI003D01F991